MTNYERIKAMSVEEMAVLLEKITYASSDLGGCWHCEMCPIGLIDGTCDIRRWLESEVDT